MARKKIPKTAKQKKPGQAEMWHSPKELYAQGDKFGVTFAKFFRPYLQKNIGALIRGKDPKKMAALEIGPGAKHTIGNMGFRENYFMDVSKEVLDSLKKELGREGLGRNSKFILGKLEELPLGKGRRFGLVVANEVLTHVRPGDRLKAVSGLADRADFLVITDREPRKLFDEESPRVRAGFVRPEPLAELLHKKGFDVKIQRPIDLLMKFGQAENYFLITAERVSGPKHALLTKNESLKVLADFTREDIALKQKFGYPKKS